MLLLCFQKEHTLTRAKEQRQRRESHLSIEIQRHRSSSGRVDHHSSASGQAERLVTSQSWTQSHGFPATDARYRSLSMKTDDLDRARGDSLDEDRNNPPV